MTRYPSAPRVDTHDRESLIAWLVWNDPNGAYTDGDCADEGLAPLTLEDLRALYHEATTYCPR